MAHKNYTPQFKTEIVLECLKELKTVEQIASEHDLNPNMVRNWRKEFLENANNFFVSSKKAEKAAKRKEAELEKKNNKMLRTIGQLTLERDFLQDCFRISGIPIPKFNSEEE